MKVCRETSENCFIQFNGMNKRQRSESTLKAVIEIELHIEP